jgi:cytochrome c oxidase subunit 4
MSTQHEVHHPTPGQYWRIAALLAILTAIEVAMFYVNDTYDLGAINAVFLLVLAAAKFIIVVGWYMHLRYEDTMLSRVFSIGFVLALALYAIVLTAMGVIALSGG